VRLVVHHLHHLLAEGAALGRVVGDAELVERVGEAHHAQPDAARGLRHVVDLRQRVAVDLDHVVEEARGAVDDRAVFLPVEARVGAVALDQHAQVDRAQVAGVEGVQRLLAAGVRGLDQAHVLDRIAVVDAVDEDDARLARRPGVLDDQVPDLADGPELLGLLALRVALLELGPLLGARVLHHVLGLGLGAQLVQEAVRDRDRDVVVGQHPEVVLHADEVDDVGVVDAQDAHVGAAPERALLDRVRGLREDLDERERALGGAAGAAHEVAGRTQAREAEARAAARLLDQGRGLDRVEDAFDRVLDREHEAGREHAHLAPGVHQRRAVGHELAPGHQLVELARDRERALRRAARELELALGDVRGDAPEQLPRRLADLARVRVLLQVAALEHRGRILGQVRVLEVARRRDRFQLGHHVHGAACVGRGTALRVVGHCGQGRH
jgi:hypothetical protein